MLRRVNLIQKAHRLDRPVAANVTDVYEGQLFHLNDNGEWDYADGTRKAYPTLNNRYSGKGLGPQGERLEGRDDVSRSGMITCLIGNFDLGIDQYDKAATYTYGAPLHPSTVDGEEGTLTIYDSANVDHKVHFICGYVTHVPEDVDDFIGYQG